MIKKTAKHDQLILSLINDQQYKIEEDGKVEKRFRAWDKTIKKELWKPCGYTDERGYRYIHYKNKAIALHRIIFAKFLGKLKANLVVNHKDGNPSNNHKDNLELITESENIIHGYRVLGNRPASAKLSWNQIDEIKTAWGSKNYTMTKLAEKYGVNKSNISRLINDKTYQYRGTNGEE